MTYRLPEDLSVGMTYPRGLLLPSVARIKIRGYNQRLERLRTDAYKRRNERTYDEKKLLKDEETLPFWRAIANISLNSHRKIKSL